MSLAEGQGRDNGEWRRGLPGAGRDGKTSEVCADFGSLLIEAGAQHVAP